MGSPIITFVVIALLCAIALWALAQFPTLDATIVKFIRIGVLVALSIMLLNLILVLLFGKGLSGFL
jgi:hypothetical protein